MQAKYKFLVQHHRKWQVRITVPTDLRGVVGQSVFKVSTGQTDIHVAATKAAPIIAGIQKRIQAARATLKPPIESEAAALATRLRAETGDAAELLSMEEILQFALRQGGHKLTEWGRILAAPTDTIEDVLDEPTRLRVDLIAGKATAFLAYLEQWKPHAGLKPRPLDQAISSLKSFDAAVAQSIESLQPKHVQAWIDGLINPDKGAGTAAKTVARKMSEVRNYWRYLQSVQIVPEDRDPFDNRRVKDPADRRTTRDTARQKWTPADVVMLWQAAESLDDIPLAQVIRMGAYTGGRIEGVAQLKVGDVRKDPKTGIRFMRMADKSIAGDRDVPIHPAIAGLVDELIKAADKDGYLIHSTAENKYGERSAPIGKRFGRLKTAKGFDARFVFHSIRKTVASLMQDAQVPEGVAADIVGHIKPGMTYGLYGGVTDMKLRAAELSRAVAYPTG